jgi:hypothetical protein
MNKKQQVEVYKEQLNYVMWCYGRLEELRRQNLFSVHRNGKLLGKRTCSLPKAGWKFYQRLKARGFKPEPEKVRWTLENLDSLPQDELNRLVFFCLVMHGQTGSHLID